MLPNQVTLGVVGGASGVGKTTLLNSVSWLDRVNTGDLFKQRMALVNRDDIRAGDWSQHEEAVTNDLLAIVRTNLAQRKSTIIDTHFAAKLRGAHYRIGLQRALIHRFATAALEEAERQGLVLDVKVVHIDGDAHALLRRRRTDATRKRELVPSDCVRALDRNRVCAAQYLSEFARAYQPGTRGSGHALEMLRVENIDLQAAVEQIQSIFRSESDVWFRMDHERR